MSNKQPSKAKQVALSGMLFAMAMAGFDLAFTHAEKMRILY